jgi:hypothetical protein
VRPPLACALLLAAAGLTACGTSRPSPPDVTSPQPPEGTRFVAYPASRLSLVIPANWRAEQGKQPLVVSVASGTALMAIWRYPRTEPLPRTPRALRAAKDALVEAAKKRDKTLKVRTAKVIRVHGRPALEIVGTETVGGELRMVRSTHLFRDRSEIVVEGLAPPQLFASLDPSVFAPALRSLKVK